MDHNRYDDGRMMGYFIVAFIQYMALVVEKYLMSPYRYIALCYNFTELTLLYVSLIFIGTM